jgi:hypothetical protein
MKSDGEIQDKGSVGMGNLIVSRTFLIWWDQKV